MSWLLICLFAHGKFQFTLELRQMSLGRPWKCRLEDGCFGNASIGDRYAHTRSLTMHHLLNRLWPITCASLCTHRLHNNYWFFVWLQPQTEAARVLPATNKFTFHFQIIIADDRRMNDLVVVVVVFGIKNWMSCVLFWMATTTNGNCVQIGLNLSGKKREFELAKGM